MDTHFSLANLAIAGDMTKRSVQYIADARLLPTGGGIRALKRIGSIGAFVAAGTPLLVAARLAEAILLEFNQNDGEAPTGLSYLARKLPAIDIASLSANGNDDYWYHRALLRHPALYQPSKALVSDVLIEIVDRRLVFLSINSDQKTLVPASAPFSDAAPKLVPLEVDASLLGWIEGWGRGEGARILSVSERIGLMDDQVNPAWRAQALLFETQAQEARKNALGKLIVNVSLAMRTALDRLALHHKSNPRRAHSTIG